MDEFDSRFVADLVGRIYQAAVEPAHWGEFVSTLERVYPESRVTLFGHDKGRPTANLAAHINYAESDLRSYADYYIGCSPYIARAAAFPVGRAFHYDMVIGDDELRRISARSRPTFQHPGNALPPPPLPRQSPVSSLRAPAT